MTQPAYEQMQSLGWDGAAWQPVYAGLASALPCRDRAAVMPFCGANVNSGAAAASPGRRTSAGPAGKPPMPLAVMLEAPAAHTRTPHILPHTQAEQSQI